MDRSKQRELMGLIEGYVAAQGMVPPLSLEELQEHTLLMGFNPLDFGVSFEWMLIMLNNALWKDTVASIAPERKLFLLPQCLKNSKRCVAQIDELGLFCEHCGACKISSLTDEADEAGMMSLVAEGSPVVRSIIEHGAADCIIGVSCFNSLKKAFPLMVDNAVPGIAIPLDCDGCVDTKVDDALVRQYLRLPVPAQPKVLLDTKALEEEVKGYFQADELVSIMGEGASAVEQTALSYLALQGKRFRPFLCAAIFRCLTDGATLTPAVKKLMVAVECFHKASLIHDDIEDGDELRDGEACLHQSEGVAIAINIGDFLLGEGYRLIAEALVEDAHLDKLACLRVASAGHLALCKGQGAELNLIEKQLPYDVEQVLDIFKGKTAPAFEVALLLGAHAAQAQEALCTLLRQFSQCFGVAYQIHDDIVDFTEGRDAQPDRLSLFIALAGEQAPAGASRAEILAKMDKAATQARAVELYEQYRRRSYEVLRQITNAELKRLLFRITTRILKDV